MPKQAASASEFTSVVKSAAVANNIASLPAGSLLAARATASAASVSRTPLSAIASIVKQTSVAKSIEPPVVKVAVIPKPDITLKRGELASASFTVVGRDMFLAKYYKTGELQWMVTITGGGNDTVRGTATDVDGNVYIVGNFRDDTLLFKDTTNTTHTLANGNATSAHSFIAKFDTLGVLQWKARIIIPSGGVAHGMQELVVDSQSNVYFVSGSNAATAFYDKNDALQFTTTGAYYGITKYNADGTYGWLWRMTYPHNAEFPLAIDSEGNLIHYWQWVGPVTLTVNNRDGTTGITLNSSSLYVMKLNPTTGKIVWMSGTSASGENNSARAIATDKDNNIYVGFHDRNATILIRDVNASSGSLISFNTSSANFTDAYMVKYNSSGTAQWVVKVRQKTGAAVATWETIDYRSIDTDSEGNVYFTGLFYSSELGFENGNGTVSSTTLTNADASGENADIFVAKFDSAGTLLWAARIGHSWNDSIPSLRVDRASNQVYVSLFASGSGTITDGLGTSTSTGVYSRMLLIKFSTNGAVLWKASNASAWGNPRISTDSFGNLFYGSATQGDPTTVFTKM